MVCLKEACPSRWFDLRRSGSGSNIGYCPHSSHWPHFLDFSSLCRSRWFAVISRSRSNIGYWSFVTRLGLFSTVLLSDDGRSGSRSNIGYWPHVAKIATPIPLLLLLLLLMLMWNWIKSNLRNSISFGFNHNYYDLALIAMFSHRKQIDWRK